MIEIKSDAKDYSLLIPTSLSEITPDMVKEMLSNQHLADNYCIIALVYRSKLFDLVAAGNSKRQVVWNHTVHLVKGENNGKESVLGIGIMDKVILHESDLERAQILRVAANDISVTNAFNYIGTDKNLASDIMRHNINIENPTPSIDIAGIIPAKKIISTPECYFLDFRIVPLSAILCGISSEQVLFPFRKKGSLSLIHI